MKYFNQNKISVGIVATLGSGLLTTLLLIVGLLIAKEPLWGHPNWYAGAFIPMILVLRYYARKKAYPLTTKTSITVFFITFIAYMFVIL